MGRPRHAFVVRDTDPISPLGHPASEAWLLGGRLWPQMRAQLERAGLAVELVDTLDDAERRAAQTPDGAIVTRDSVAFSRDVLARLLAAFSREPAASLVAALLDTEVSRRLAPIDGLTPATIDGAPAFTAPLWAIGRGGSLAGARPAPLRFKETVVQLPLPPGMLGQASRPLGLSDTFLCRVDHWLHILRVNQAALAATWAARANTWGGRFWYLWRALCGFPWTRGRLAGAIRRIHRKTRVHHTAHVELSVIEEGAEVGAHAIVKSSWIGRGARIDDGAIVNGAVVGEGAFVASASTVVGAVLYPRSFAAQSKMQMCVFGEGATALTGSFFYDVNFHHHVRVAHRGRVVDGGDHVTGVCLGPWARVAGSVWVASGREIPAGALVVQSPDAVLHDIDPALAAAQMTAVRDRRLVGLGGAIPPNRPKGDALPEKT